MENEVVSPIVGRVLDVKAAPGDAVGPALVIVG
jgi:biotin carboxyl carrier protein